MILDGFDGSMGNDGGSLQQEQWKPNHGRLLLRPWDRIRFARRDLAGGDERLDGLEVAAGP